MRSRLVASSIAVASFMIVGTAFAQGEPAPAAPTGTAPAAGTTDPNAPATTPAQPATGGNAEKPKKPEGEEEEELKHITLTANPLSLILTRIGINVDYMITQHHGIELNPSFQI